MAAPRDATQPIIAHGSVFLRAPERDDIPRFVGWLNDYATSRTLGVHAPLSIPLEEQWFERMIASQGTESYHFVACLATDGRAIGAASLQELDLRNGSAGLAIVIGAAVDRGQGHGTDVLRALLAFGFGFLRLERIWLDVYQMNPGARRAYERVGFVHEGVLRHAAFREGRYLDMDRMSILAGEWRATLGSDPWTP